MAFEHILIFETVLGRCTDAHIELIYRLLGATLRKLYVLSYPTYLVARPCKLCDVLDNSFVIWLTNYDIFGLISL